VYEFKLPDIGEGVAEGEILKWMVKEGDSVKEGQPLLEVMTDKVNVQIPTPRTGTVSKILMKEGDLAKVGQTIIIIDDGSGGAAPSAQPIPSTQPQSPSLQQAPSVQAGLGILATPATRKLARELGVDIASVKGSGPQGRVSDEDVRKAASSASRQTLVQVPAQTNQGAKEEIIPLRGMRRAIAEHMVKSEAITAQVTHVDEADMSELVLLREAFKGSAEKRGVRLTYLPFIIKALIPAFKEFPYVNASLDEQSGNIILKKYYNMGIATDTEQGLVVPVVKNADSKDIFELAGEIEKLASTARAGKLSLDEIRGSTFTITNVGAVGGLLSTPIINYPEVAILGLHKITKRPVVREGKIEIRDVTDLSLTFDHRVFDGAYAARFTSKVIQTIQDTKKLLAEVL
jgi:pyruvate dehydrogenase E2 component (dihydrolipoamide acetyltransferase)